MVKTQASNEASCEFTLAHIQHTRQSHHNHNTCCKSWVNFACLICVCVCVRDTTDTYRVVKETQ